MTVPTKEVTEPLLLEAIDKVSGVLAANCTFGYYDVDDIKQQIALFCLEALPRYDPQNDENGEPRRPLANFLYSHCKNQLINFYRNKCHRSDPPCLQCHNAERPSECHEGSGVCGRYAAWKKRNGSKAHLLHPPSMGEIQPAGGEDDQAEAHEAIRLIDTRLPMELRPDWLRMRAGEALPKSHREAVENAIEEILQ